MIAAALTNRIDALKRYGSESSRATSARAWRAFLLEQIEAMAANCAQCGIHRRCKRQQDQAQHDANDHDQIQTPASFDNEFQFVLAYSSMVLYLYISLFFALRAKNDENVKYLLPQANCSTHFRNRKFSGSSNRSYENSALSDRSL